MGHLDTYEMCLTGDCAMMEYNKEDESSFQFCKELLTFSKFQNFESKKCELLKFFYEYNYNFNVFFLHRLPVNYSGLALLCQY